MTPEFGKILMLIGGIVFVVGAAATLNLLPWLGRLPGDISVRKGNFSFYFPILTCVVVSVFLTLLACFFHK